MEKNNIWQAAGSVPHIKSVEAATNKYDPVHSSLFALQFSYPDNMPQLTGTGVSDIVNILPQQVTTVSGLDALQRTVQAGSQKFYGVDVSYLNPVLDNTFAEFTIEFNLNINDAQDVYVLSFFKAWSKLGYGLANDAYAGQRKLKKDYTASELFVWQANRDGFIWREVKFINVMLTNVTGLDSLDYTNNEPAKLTCTFRADEWMENFANAK